MNLVRWIVFLLAADCISAAIVVETECASVNQRALASIQDGQAHEAQTLLAEWIGRLEDSMKNKTCLGLSHYNLALALDQMGKLDEAARAASRSVREFESLLRADDPILRRPVQFLAQAAIGAGNTAEARRYLHRAELLQSTGPGDSAYIHGVKANLLFLEGKPTEAETEYLMAIADWERAGQLDTFGLGSELVNLANLYGETGRYDQATALLKRAFLIVEQPPFNPVTRVKANAAMAAVKFHSDDPAASERYYRRALSLADSLRAGPEQKLARQVFVEYAAALRKWGRRREAKVVDEEIKRRFGLDTSTMVVTADSLGRGSAHH